jgi:hypothetical protein
VGIFGRRKREKQYITMSSEELRTLNDDELRDAISARMMKEAGRREVVQCLDLFTGAKGVFYVASLYEAEVNTDGLCRFLVGPGRSAAGSILDALREIHASRHAELLRKFTSDNGINLNDLGDLRIENSWEYDDVKGKYPFDTFNEKFQKLYDKESIDSRLMQYVRNHIEEF